MNAIQLLHKSKKELEGFSSNPYQESLWIAASVLDCSSNEIYLKKEELNQKQKALFWSQIKRRKQKEPLEYILKEKFFFKYRFYIEKGVFIPRPETETIIQWMLSHKQQPNLKAMDFGAGPGTLCLSLLSLFPDSQFLALEICKKALKCLQKNSQHLRVKKRLSILQTDVQTITQKEVISILGSPPSLITANPPYIDPKDQKLSPDVFLFDPPIALFSDHQGMGHINSWFQKAMELLTPKGIYIFEFGWNQENLVRDFCQQQQILSSYEIHQDQFGRARIAVCFKK